MKALTICQPYAQLICLPESDPRHKRIENRHWYADYRGPLLIHAGKSREWLSPDETGERDELYDLSIPQMPFGCLVAVCQMAGCVSWPCTVQDLVRWPWLRTHEHAEGPFCFVLEDVLPFEKPVPYRGQQGLFDVPVAAKWMELDGRNVDILEFIEASPKSSRARSN